MAEQGAAAFGEKRFADAVDLFTRAEALVQSPVHLLYIARANTELGRLVKAQEAYIKIVRTQLEPGSPNAFKKAVSEAEAELERLKPRIPQVTVHVTGAEGAPPEVFVDGEAVPPVMVGVAMPIDPGTRKFEARAEGMVPAERELVVEEGQQSEVELELVAAPTQVAPSISEATSSDVAIAPPRQDDSNAMLIGAWSGVAVGVVGVGLGTWFFVDKLGIESDADDLAAQCSRSCQEPQRSEIEQKDQDAADAGTKALIAYAVGGIGFAAGVTLFVLSGSESDVAQGPTVAPWVGLGSVGFRGRF